MQLLDFKLTVDRILNQKWWVRIDTKIPACTYYFGPFCQREEARNSQIGYVDDLVGEGAQEIRVKIERARPQNLTIYGHEELHLDRFD